MSANLSNLQNPLTQLDEKWIFCIEMFREMNTISSKTQQINVTKNIIEGKNELERIREQVQNIE